MEGHGLGHRTMKREIKKFCLRAGATYVVAFVLLYLLGWWVGTLPAISLVSLSRSFDTLSERLRFASQMALLILVFAAPFLVLSVRSRG